MNSQTRKGLQKLSDRLEKLKEEIEDIKGELEIVAGEEQDKYDNMPEGLQNSERGENMNMGITYLEEGAGNLDDILSTIDSVTESIESAMN